MDRLKGNSLARLASVVNAMKWSNQGYSAMSGSGTVEQLCGSKAGTPDSWKTAAITSEGPHYRLDFGLNAV